ncbi:class I SAM-dependent methyltransferase [Ochrobactrum teleogrylli]
MKHIHPFPARMAPEIALEKIQSLKPGQTVLDPMTGSGMVLSQAVRSGISAIGVDLDPLAELISRVGATSVDEDEVRGGLNTLLERCAATPSDVRLPWIDEDVETANFIDFWFAPKQKEQLRKLSFHLLVQPLNVSADALDVLKVALSRLIITKEPKASLARDTAHSRPHRTIQKNDFDVLGAMQSSLSHVLSALDAPSFKMRAETFLGDARNLTVVESDTVDCIVTSPPYLNAIDYMRGHRMSLVWLGYRLEDLRKIRGSAIGAERALNSKLSDDFVDIIIELGLDQLENKNKFMLDRYFSDLMQQTKEAYRVLKKGSIGTYVIGNSTIRGTYVRNSELLKRAGTLAGFEILGETEREIPDHRRYMPMRVIAGNSLASRMRTEHIIDFRKPI